MSQKRKEQSGASKRKRKQIDEAKKNTNNSSFKNFFTSESIEPADSNVSFDNEGYESDDLDVNNDKVDAKLFNLNSDIFNFLWDHSMITLCNICLKC